jgi:cytoskeletal protein CcmA (bactofilin family)
MKRQILIMGLMVAWLLPLGAQASTIEAGEAYSLGVEEAVSDNLYVGAANVSLAGSAEADALVAGGNVTVTGPVGADLSVAGGNLVLQGAVGGDLRTVGGTISISGPISGELMAAGGNLNLTASASVDGDVRMAGGNLAVQGAVGGDLVLYGEEARLDGPVTGDVRAEVGRLVLGPNAVVRGSLTHTGPNETILEPGAAVSGETVYVFKSYDGGEWSKMSEAKDMKSRAGILASIFFMFLLVKFFIYLLTSSLAAILFPKAARTLTDRTLKNFGPDLLTGFLTVLLVPAIIGILFSVVLGSLAGIALIALLVLLGVLAAIFAPIAFGGFVMNFVRKHQDYPADWKAAALGVALLFALGLIPVLGWLLVAAVWLASYGSLLRLSYEKYWLNR